MSEYIECDAIQDATLKQLCRGERGTVADCNHIRAGWEFAPLPVGWIIQRKPHVVGSTAKAAIETGICCERGRTLELLQVSAPCTCDRRIFACQQKGRCVQLDPGKATASPLVAEARRKGIQLCKECELFDEIPQ